MLVLLVTINVHIEEVLERWDQSKHDFGDETAFINSAVQAKPSGRGYLVNLDNPRIEDTCIHLHNLM